MKIWIALFSSLVFSGLPTLVMALTVDEILLLKNNGVSEKTIQMMLESEAQAATTGGTAEQPGTQTIVRPNGQTAIIYSTGDRDIDRSVEERRREDQAWEMLRYLIIDTRNE